MSRHSIVVEIPDGGKCYPCVFYATDAAEGYASCDNPEAPKKTGVSFQKDPRPEWCRSRYGVKQ